MAKTSEKFKIKSTIFALTITLIVFLNICFVCFRVIYEKERINIKQNLPELENCVLDFSGCDLSEKYVKQHMIGDYEFFYNKWIVEDNYQGLPDAIVSVPHHFSQTEIDGKQLSNEGYASYRIYVKGLKKGTEFYFLNNNFIGACYGYVNGQLIYKYGTHQKTGDCESNGGAELSAIYIVQDENPLEVVFEVSSSKQGGLTSPFRLTINSKTVSPASPNFTNNIGFIVLGLAFALFVFSFIINFNTSKKKSFSFIFVMLTVLLLTAFSICVYWRLLSFLRWNNYNMIMDINFFLNFALIFSLLWHLLEKKKIMKSKLLIVSLSLISLVSIVLYFALMGTFYQFIAIALQCVCLIIFVYPLAKVLFEGKRWNVLYILLIINFLILITLTSMDLMNITICGLERITAYIIMPILLMVIILYRHISVEQSKKLISALETEKQVHLVKAEALKAQIKPHFIFNSLSNIQSAYEQDKVLGDKALTMFSKHLRANIDSNSVDKVLFSQELDIIMNYIELENMRRKKPIEVLLDCLDVEFDLPIFSLQPFIENAFKYSGVENKEGGYIQLKTYESEQYYVVEIVDNGIGFNLQDVKNKSVGLKNATERLKIISSAKVEIKTSIGNGTNIVIKFPKANLIKKENKNEYNSY